MSKPLVFLHLSDIHFSRRSSTAYDPDLDLRRELVADAVRMKEQVKICSGILVSGDIAFSGKPDEYSKARDWLREICHVLDCSEEAVWVILGNHDVDRDAFRRSSIIQDKHQKLRTGDALKGELEQEILRVHEDPEAFEALHLTCRSLLSWVNDGSHFAQDDLYHAIDDTMVERYLRDFRLIFQKTRHTAHYDMMMRTQPDVTVGNVNGPVEAPTVGAVLTKP